MRTVEYKLARLEEQNAALHRKLRHQENEISRLSVRESQLKEARRIPLLQKRLDDALAECEDLECQLIETRGREVKLSDEVNLLRTFVQLDKNPALAEAARQRASDDRIQEELKALGVQLRTIAEERDEYKKRALLSCEEAEYYRDKWNSSFSEKQRLEEYIKKLLAEQKASVGVFPSPCVALEQRSSLEVIDEGRHGTNGIQHLRRSLEEERTRNETLQETLDALYEQQKEHRRSRSHERPPSIPVDPPSGMNTPGQCDSDSAMQALRQQVALAEGECVLLTKRWRALSEQNQSLLERLAEQERMEVSWRNQLHQMSMECERLKRELELVSQARSLVSRHHGKSCND
ncbi:hypothetical protein DQ04_01051140 [Trypanosoma grayi]|uniref:hypothetical protein n=1 Tax=Trypanosoma grayi TaxID=71804 RepID=UPI0004F40BBA|nr:hypothetical protein DQ04_01051140 [Trypanosoma grayi]KEG13361.1 hypothetical protein DQ04_01051140 [Trypanosoma grayi]